MFFTKSEKIKRKLRYLYLASHHILILILLSKRVAIVPILGKTLSTLIDSFIRFAYGTDLTSTSLDIKNLVVGHPVGVVLGGNGIKSDGLLHVSSGVVFAQKYKNARYRQPFFEFHGDVIIGANTVLVGPLKIIGPTYIGALSLVDKDIIEPGTYIGSPVKKVNEK